MSTISPAPYFLRMGNSKTVNALLKEARRVKYKVTRELSFRFEVVDPTHNNAKVLTGLCVSSGVWAIKYFRDYWQENTPVGPATPEKFRAYITASPIKA